jgi:hypothetical protein
LKSKTVAKNKTNQTMLQESSRGKRKGIGNEKRKRKTTQTPPRSTLHKIRPPQMLSQNRLLHYSSLPQPQPPSSPTRQKICMHVRHSARHTTSNGRRRDPERMDGRMDPWWSAIYVGGSKKDWRRGYDRSGN